MPDLTAAEFAALRESIERDGILSPLDISAANVVLDGHQRLRVALELGLSSVPVQVLRPASEVEHILMRLLTGRNLSASQRAAVAVDLEAVHVARDYAAARRNSQLRRGTERPVSATLPEREDSRSLAARIAGVSPRTVQDAHTVRDADPLLFERVKRGEIAANQAARQVRRIRLHASIGQAPELPDGPFELIYADPPWQLGHPDAPSAPESHYPTMTASEIAALNVPSADAAILYLWALSSLLPAALQVMSAWGFEPKTTLVWVKPSIGLGKWARNRHELLLVGRKGAHPPPAPEDLPDSVIEAPKREHSRKPDQVYELIERAYPAASKLELFARNTRPGWAAWGNQAAGQART